MVDFKISIFGIFLWLTRQNRNFYFNVHNKSNSLTCIDALSSTEICKSQSLLCSFFSESYIFDSNSTGKLTQQIIVLIFKFGITKFLLKLVKDYTFEF